MGILDSLESGLKSALPYALPAVLGAGLGGPLGALAGVAAAQPDPDEQLKRQKAQLDIKSEEAGLQQATQQRAAEQKFFEDPGFKQYAAQALGVDPAHVPSFAGLSFGEASKFIENAQKAREAGLKGPIVKQGNDFGIQTPSGFKSFGSGAIPANVIAERERGEAESGRQDKSIAATKANVATTQTEADKRAAAAAAARQQMTPAQIGQAMDRGYSNYVMSHGKPPILGLLETKESWAKGAIMAMMAEPGVDKQAAQEKAAGAIGWVPLGRVTKDGKPVYLDLKTRKKYTF